MKLLLIEDDKKIATAIKRGLEGDGFSVSVAFDGPNGVKMASQSHHDALIVDILLPGMNGLEVCAELRESGNWTPILMLTDKDGDIDESEALDFGADDYITKPFSFPVLVARLRSLLRRTSGVAPVAVQVGDLRVDPGQRRVWRGEDEIQLTARQLDVLEFLLRRAGDVMSREEILAGVWEHDFEGDPNIVEVYIRRLRARIDEPFNRKAIETVRGAGYRLALDGG